MSDRTSFQLRIYDCPAEEAGAILDQIDELALGHDWDDDTPADHDALTLVTFYTGLEVMCGVTGRLAETLVRAAPSASWECWEDPACGWLGELARFTPTLGLWTGECDDTGTHRPAAAAALDMIVGDDWSVEQAQRKLGITHERALAALVEGNEGKTVRRNTPRSAVIA